MREATAQMPLLDFGILHYMAAAHHKSGDPPGPSTLAKLRTLAKYMREVLGHKARLSDLSEANRAALMAHLQSLGRKPKSVTILDAMFVAVWRFAAASGVVELPAHLAPKPGGWCRNRGSDGKTIALSDADGTLWGLCVSRYFPRNLRIRSADTKRQYVYAMRDFKAYLGHDATLADLSDDNLAGLADHLRGKGLAPKTCNERCGRIACLWRWAAQKRLVEEFPSMQRLVEPRRIPKAWSREDLAKLLAACRSCLTKIGEHMGRDWWYALHLVLWDTGERISAVMQLQWDWIDLAAGDVIIPAEARKGGSLDMAYWLHPETRAAIGKLRRPDVPRVFVWPHASGYLWVAYKKIRKRAGLATDRRSGFHRMRRSVASHVQAAGYSASDVLQHSSPALTRKSYLDPAITGTVKASAVLFRPQ